MKPSYYNLLTPEETGGAVLFNTRSGCMAQLDREHYEALRAFEKRGEVPEDKEFREGLLACGFAVEDRENELEAIRLGLLRARFATETLSLTIAPTQDCNFQCVYCYEKDQLRHQVVDAGTRDKILEYVTKLAPHIRRLNICWYGGEPLLAQDTIRALSEAFLKLCEEHHVDYSADIITNGSLLNEKAIDLLNDCRVTQIQVTLDGSRASHDSRRPLAGGGGSFDTILRNLKLCREHYKGAIALRMNVDKNNLSEIEEVKTLLKAEGLDKTTFLYLGHVVDENGTCTEGSCLGGCEFVRQNLEFLLGQEDGGKRFRQGVPRPIANCCGADYGMAWVIGPDGRLYRCLQDIGIFKLAVGDIHDPDTLTDPELYTAFLLFDPTRDPKCKECKYLPLCMGGTCPRARLNGHRDCGGVAEQVRLYLAHPEQFEEVTEKSEEESMAS